MIAAARGRRWSVVVVLLTMFLVGALATSCRDATQVSLEAQTNVAYRSNIVTSFTVGSSDVAVEAAEATTESVTPWGSDGFVGSLTVVPSESNDGILAIKIIMGIGRAPRECRAPLYEGCIVARRLVNYTPHRSLRLPIALWSQCEGVPCDAFSTCNALRQCVSAKVDSASCATSDGCTVPGDEGRSVIDSGVDARPLDAAAAVDATAALDAAPDAQGDASQGDGGTSVGLVECGSTPCSSPQQFCCAKTPSNYCGTVAFDENDCLPFGGMIVQCDGPEDCPPDIPICCYGSNRFSCSNDCVQYPVACHSNGICPAGKTCTGVVKGYRYCSQP